MINPNQEISIQAEYILVERAPDYEVVLSEMPETLDEIVTACRQAGCDKVLIVGSRTKVRLSAMDIFDLGEAIARLGLQIAVVESHDASIEEVKFLETVVSNRGSPIQFFDNREDAERWLGVT